MKLNNQLFITNNPITSDWVNLSEFSLSMDIDDFNILDFFNSDHYKNDFLNQVLKNSNNDLHLEPMFIGNKFGRMFYRINMIIF